jgi:hypothetical protein
VVLKVEIRWKLGANDRLEFGYRSDSKISKCRVFDGDSNVVKISFNRRLVLEISVKIAENNKTNLNNSADNPLNELARVSMFYPFQN